MSNQDPPPPIFSSQYPSCPHIETPPVYGTLTCKTRAVVFVIAFCHAMPLGGVVLPSVCVTPLFPFTLLYLACYTHGFTASLKPDAAHMPVIKVEPSNAYPVPYDTVEEKPTSLLEEIALAGNTAELLVNMGAPLELDENTAKEAKKLADMVQKRETKNLNQVTTAFGAAQFLRAYGQQLALDANQVRAAITFKLMELANYGDPKVELKALELLGKHSDIGLFTSKSEITINYKDPTELENAIKERVKRLLNADIIDITPLGQTIEEELAHFDHNEIEEILDTGFGELDEMEEAQLADMGKKDED